MENQPNSVPPVQAPPVVNPPPPTNHWKMIAIIAICLLIIVLTASTMLIFKYVVRKDQAPDLVNIPISIPTLQPTLHPTPKVGPMPAEWTFKKSTACSVSFPFPPKKEPYFIPGDPYQSGNPVAGAYWHLEEASEAQDSMFDKGFARLILRQDDAASGYVPGMVSLSCGLNTAGYTTETLAKKLTQLYPPSIKTGTDKDLAVTTTTFQPDTMLWGRTVKVATIDTGGMINGPFYIFATPTNIYKVYNVTGSELDSVQQMTQQIFENLQFETTSRSKTAGDAMSNWKTYTNTYPSFSIQYPTDWRIDTSKAEVKPVGTDGYVSELIIYKGAYKITYSFPSSYGPNGCIFDDQLELKKQFEMLEVCPGKFVQFGSSTHNQRRLEQPLSASEPRWFIYTQEKPGGPYVTVPPVSYTASTNYDANILAQMDEIVSKNVK